MKLLPKSLICVCGRLPVLALMVMWLLIGPASAGSIYIKIDSVPGDEREGRFTGWSEVVSLAHGVAVTQDPTVPPAPTPPTFTCRVGKRIDQATPFLVERCGTGLVLGRVTLAYAEGGAALYRIVLEEVTVESVGQRVDDAPEALPVEEISLRFRKASWSAIDVTEVDEIVGGLTTHFDLALGTGELKPRLAFRASVDTEAEPGTLRIRCPVEQGRRYRLAMTTELRGAWATVIEFTAERDGIFEHVLRSLPGVAFMRVEELD